MGETSSIQLSGSCSSRGAIDRGGRTVTPASRVFQSAHGLMVTLMFMMSAVQALLVRYFSS